MSKVKKKDRSKYRFKYTAKELKSMDSTSRALIKAMQQDEEAIKRLQDSGKDINKLLQKRMGMEDLDIISSELSPSSDPTTAFAIPMHSALATRDDHGYGVRAHELGHIKDYQHGGTLAKLRNIAYSGAQPLSTALAFATPIVAKGRNAQKLGIGLAGLSSLASPYAILKSEHEAWRHADPVLDAIVKDKEIKYSRADRRKDAEIKELALGTYRRGALPQFILGTGLNLAAFMAGTHVKEIMERGKHGFDPTFLGHTLLGTAASIGALRSLNNMRKMRMAKERDERIRHLKSQLGKNPKNIRGNPVKLNIHRK